MKKILLVVIYSILFVSIINAQITIKKDIVENPVLKPKPFDSLMNFRDQKNPIDYKQYIGQKLFFIPKSNKYKPKSLWHNNDTTITFLHTQKMTEVIKTGAIPYEETDVYKAIFGRFSKEELKKDKNYNAEYIRRKSIWESKQREQTDIYQPYFIHQITDKSTGDIIGQFATMRQFVENKYFTILDIQGTKIYQRNYERLEDIDKDNFGKNLKIILKNNETEDTIFWLVNEQYIDNMHFILVSYFVKNKTLYENKKFIAEKEINGLVEINTGEIINIKPKEKWICTEVNFIELESSFYCEPFYILKNDNGKEVKIKLGGITENNFITEEQYNRREQLAKMQEEEKLKEEENQEKLLKDEQIKFKSNCIKRFGEKYGVLISEGKVVLGMTKEMCIMSWGEPIDINRTTVTGLVHEQWVYSWKNYLYFENGKLTAIQN